MIDASEGFGIVIGVVLVAIGLGMIGVSVRWFARRWRR